MCDCRWAFLLWWLSWQEWTVSEAPSHPPQFRSHWALELQIDWLALIWFILGTNKSLIGLWNAHAHVCMGWGLMSRHFTIMNDIDFRFPMPRNYRLTAELYKWPGISTRCVDFSGQLLVCLRICEGNAWEWMLLVSWEGCVLLLGCEIGNMTIGHEKRWMSGMCGHAVGEKDYRTI